MPPLRLKPTRVRAAPSLARNQIVNLPLNGRSYADLALLAPGVRKSGIAQATSRDASFNVNGMRSSLNNFVIDGVDNNAYGTSNQGFSNQVVQLSPDAVQEFRIETTNYSAEFGRAGGGVINASIRSGTNSFHGSAWEYLRNTELNATGFFKPVNNEKPVLIQNQFGASIRRPGHPQQGVLLRRLRRLPPYPETAGILDTADIGTAPGQSRHPRSAIRTLVKSIANGVIPQAQITRFAREVLAGLPARICRASPTTSSRNPLQTDDSNKGDVRYDHYLGSRVNLFARYSHRELNQFIPPSIPGPSGGDSNGNVRVNNKQIALGVELHCVSFLHARSASWIFAHATAESSPCSSEPKA